MPDQPRPTCASGSERPSDELLLAALRRALLHDPGDRGAVPLWTVLEHLDVARRSVGARHVRARLRLLLAAGWVTRSRRHGTWTWTLTAAGSRYLERAAAAGRASTLPESPQHRAWRRAHTLARHELARLRCDLSGRVADTAQLLEAHPPPHSDAWFALGEELARACWRVGSASHCAYEWAEPGDDRADVDTRAEGADTLLDPAARVRLRARRSGRRNVRLW